MQNHLTKLKTCSRLHPYLVDDVSHFKCIEPSEWFYGNKLDQGNFGVVYQACCDQDCRFVVKMIHHKLKRNIFTKQFDKFPSKQSISDEISLQNSFHQYQLAPAILEAFYCEDTDTSYLIMEPKQSNLKSFMGYLEQRYLSTFDQKYVNMCILLVKQALHLLNTAHSYGLYHNDSHFKNFMSNIPTHKLEKEFDEAMKTLQFIDFGIAKSVKLSPSFDQQKIAENERKRLFLDLKSFKVGQQALQQSSFQ